MIYNQLHLVTRECQHVAGSVISIVTRLQNGQPKNRGLIPSSSNKLFTFPVRLYWLWGPTQLPLQWLQGALFPGILADSSPPSNAEVNNE